MNPNVGDEVVISFIAIVEEVFSSQGSIDLIRVNSEGVSHSFWPADERSFQATILRKSAGAKR
tara:strand:- start:3470 stop:3658 length:189 start_codon:yes stop_codon:yes gene_type:complete